MQTANDFINLIKIIIIIRIKKVNPFLKGLERVEVYQDPQRTPNGEARGRAIHILLLGPLTVS